MIISNTGNYKSIKKIDKIGILISFLCLLHCLAGPILTLLFSLNSFAENEMVHLASLVAVCVISYFAFFARGSYKTLSAKFAMAGICVLLAGFGLEAFFHEAAELLEIPLTLIGTSLMMYAHYKNNRS